MATALLAYDQRLLFPDANNTLRLTQPPGTWQHLHAPGGEENWHYDIEEAGDYKVTAHLRGQMLKRTGGTAQYATLKAGVFFDGVLVEHSPLIITSTVHGEWSINTLCAVWPIRTDGPGVLDIRCAIFCNPAGSIDPGANNPNGSALNWFGVSGDVEGGTWFFVEGV